MNNIKAVILDLDGTLLNDSKEISDDTISILKYIKNDIKIIPASARPFCRIKPYLEQLDLLDSNNYSICFNGSLIVNNMENVIFSSNINEDVIIKLDDFILENNIDWTFYLYDSRVLRKDISDIDEFVTRNRIYKIVGISDCNVIDKIRRSLPSFISDNLEITCSELDRIEFVNKGITKVNAIEMLLNKLNISNKEIIAIGDGDNDIDMIRYAGIGIAMLNAPEKVKENADFITDYSNNDDGVYHTIVDFIIDK